MVRTNGTFTAEGFILHCDFDGLLCPVKIVKGPDGRAKVSVRAGETVPVPMRRGSKLVFALPGGGEFEA